MKVSVAMFAYNHEKFIAQALSSILAQRVNFEYEIIVGEDCSTDATREIVKDFQRRYPQKIIPLLRERNVGRWRNLQEVLAACRGQYMAILEGDDYWVRDDKLQTQVDFLDAHPDHTVCCTRALLVTGPSAAGTTVGPQIPEGSYEMTNLFDNNFIMTCTVMYRWGSLGLLPDWLQGLKFRDWPLHILVARSGKIRLMNEVMSAYRVHAGGVWSSLTDAQREKAIMEMLATVDKHLEYRYTGIIRRSVARRYLNLASLARRQGSRLETAKYLLTYARNGGLRLPFNRFVAGLAGYSLVGSWYKVFSRANSANST